MLRLKSQAKPELDLNVPSPQLWVQILTLLGLVNRTVSRVFPSTPIWNISEGCKQQQEINRWKESSAGSSFSLWILGGKTKVCRCAKIWCLGNKSSNKLHPHFRSWRGEGTVTGRGRDEGPGDEGLLHCPFFRRIKGQSSFACTRKNWHQRKELKYAFLSTLQN